LPKGQGPNIGAVQSCSQAYLPDHSSKNPTNPGSHLLQLCSHGFTVEEDFQGVKATSDTALKTGDMYTCQVSRLRRDCHACGSKTAISRLLTPAFPFLTPGGKV